MSEATVVMHLDADGNVGGISEPELVAKALQAAATFIEMLGDDSSAARWALPEQVAWLRLTALAIRREETRVLAQAVWRARSGRITNVPDGVA